MVLTDSGSSRFTRSPAALSDEELERELRRRREARRARPAPDATAGASRPHTRRSASTPEQEPPSPQHKQLRQFYANLELSPDASLDDVDRAYRTLLQRYHPDRHTSDPERYRAATELAQSLTRAYRVLTAHLGGEPGSVNHS